MNLRSEFSTYRTGHGIWFRCRMASACTERGIRVRFPSVALCTDNGAMIARAGASRLERGERTSLDVGADPALVLAG